MTDSEISKQAHLDQESGSSLQASEKASPSSPSHAPVRNGEQLLDNTAAILPGALDGCE
jgi:hypothetical protein